MGEQRELEQRVRSLYELTRAKDPRVVERKTPAAALDALLRAAESEEVSAEGEPIKVHSLSGAFTPPAARRALAVAGRPFSSGSLVVTDGLRDLALLFTPSGVKALALGFRFPPLTKRLIEKGRVETGQLKRLESVTKRHRGEQEALVALGIAADIVNEVAAETVGQTLLDALFWSDGCFEAIAGEADAEARDRRDVDTLTLSSKNAKAVVQGVVEKLHELGVVHRALPTLQVPLQEGPRLSDKSGSLSGKSVEILTVVSKKPGILAAEVPDKLVEAGSPRMALHVLAKEVQELVAKGLLATGKPGKVEEKVRPPEEGLGPTARRLRLAKVLNDAGDRRSAARHLSRAGTDLLARSRATEAARCLGAAHALHAEDLEAHDGYAKALVACERKDEARAESEALVRRYLDSRLPGRARRTVSRTLQEKDELPLQLLQLEALVALGEARAIGDAGERVIGRLRQTGFKREAQELADALADQAADVPARDRLLRAGGVTAGSPIVGRLAVALVAALALGLVPAMNGLRARGAYARAVTDATATLSSDRLAFERVEEMFAPLEKKGGEPGEAARRVVQRARAHGEDWVTLLAVKRALGQNDVDLVLQRCSEAKPHTESMRALIKQLAEQATARRTEAQVATEELTQLVSRGQLVEAYACARRLLAEFPDVPAVLRDLSLPITIDSPTPGAALKWNKTPIPQRVPLTASIPIMEERHVEVSAMGHETVARVLRVSELEGPELRIVLRPAAGGGPRTTEAPPPPPTPEPSEAGGVTLRDGVTRGVSNDEAQDLPRFPPLRALEGITVPAGWRARVDAVHEVRQGQVVLVMLTVTVEERQPNDTWLPERPLSIGLPRPIVRGPMGADGRTPPPVAPLDAASGLDPAWLRERVQRTVNSALERRQGGGR